MASSPNHFVPTRQEGMLMSDAHETLSVPPILPGNPGRGVFTTLRLLDEDIGSIESANVVDIAASVFTENGYSVTKEKSWFVHDESGFLIQPRFVHIQPMENGLHTVTTTQIHHPTLTPGGVFEYQHSFGNNLAATVAKGLDMWVQTDFVTLLESLRDKPASCMVMEMNFPETEEASARVRRAVFGPVAHFMAERPEEPANESEEHPFCPCCLLTRSFEAFKQMVASTDFLCLRLYAARDDEGQPQADCRVNGEDWEAGAQALRDYALTWPQHGYEFRKQYVVLQTLERSSSELGDEVEELLPADAGGPKRDSTI